MVSEGGQRVLQLLPDDVTTPSAHAGQPPVYLCLVQCAVSLPTRSQAPAAVLLSVLERLPPAAQEGADRALRCVVRPARDGAAPSLAGQGVDPAPSDGSWIELAQARHLAQRAVPPARLTRWCLVQDDLSPLATTLPPQDDHSAWLLLAPRIAAMLAVEDGVLAFLPSADAQRVGEGRLRASAAV